MRFTLITINLFAILINLLLAGLILYRRKDLGARMLAYIIIAICPWILVQILYQFTETSDQIYRVGRLSIIGPLFIPILFLLFSLYFTDKVPTKSQILFLSLPLIIALPLVPTKHNFSTTSIYQKDPLVLDTSRLGFLFYFFTTYFIIYITIAVIRLIKAEKVSKGAKKTQLQYILFGTMIAGGIGIYTNSIATLINPSASAHIFGGPISLIFSCSVAYAMLKHRLFGFVFLIRRAGVATGIIILLSTLYLALNLLFSLWLSTVISPAIAMVIAVVLSVLFYPLLYPQFQRWVPKILFPSQYTIEERDLHLKQLLIHSSNLRKISTQLQSYLMQHFQASHVEIYFFENTTQTYRSLDDHLPIFHQSDAPISWIREHSTALIDLEQHDSKTADYFRERGLGFILPLIHPEDGLLGWIGFASTMMHEEDAMQLKKWIPNVAQSFYFILQYEDAMTRVKKDGIYPKHL